MANYPEWMQFILLMLILGFLPLFILVFIGRFIPKDINMILLLITITVQGKMSRSIQVDKNIKDLAGGTFLVMVIVIIILHYKYKNSKHN